MFMDRPPAGAAGVGAVRADAIAAPAAAVAAVKAYLRIETDAEDALVARLVATAIDHCEEVIGRRLIARPMRQWLPAATRQWQRLGATPVSAIGALEVAAGTEGGTAPLPVTAYGIDVDAGGDGWVRVLDAGGAGRVLARFTAGLAIDWADVPEAVAQGVIRLAAHLFTHRDAPEAAPPAAIAALWRPWRRIRLS